MTEIKHTPGAVEAATIIYGRYHNKPGLDYNNITAHGKEIIQKHAAIIDEETAAPTQAARITELEAENDKFVDRIEELKDENAELKDQVSDLTDRVNELDDQVSGQKDQIAELEAKP